MGYMVTEPYYEGRQRQGAATMEISLYELHKASNKKGYLKNFRQPRFRYSARRFTWVKLEHVKNARK